jgi:molybdopterin converting factor subunit 1
MVGGRSQRESRPLNTVTIRFFARLKNIAGLELLSLDLSSECTLKQLVFRLEEIVPNLKGALSAGHVQMAINQEFADQSASVKPGDEVAFLPPFSGG